MAETKNTTEVEEGSIDLLRESDFYHFPLTYVSSFQSFQYTVSNKKIVKEFWSISTDEHHHHAANKTQYNHITTLLVHTLDPLRSCRPAVLFTSAPRNPLAHGNLGFMYAMLTICSQTIFRNRPSHRLIG